MASSQFKYGFIRESALEFKAGVTADLIPVLNVGDWQGTLMGSDGWVKYKEFSDPQLAGYVFFCKDNTTDVNSDGVSVGKFNNEIQYQMSASDWAAVKSSSRVLKHGVLTDAQKLEAANEPADGSQITDDLHGDITYELIYDTTTAPSVLTGCYFLVDTGAVNPNGVPELASFYTNLASLGAMFNAFHGDDVDLSGHTEENIVTFLTRVPTATDGLTVDVKASGTGAVFDADFDNGNEVDTTNSVMDNELEVDATGTVSSDTPSTDSLALLTQIQEQFAGIKCEELMGIGDIDDYKGIFEATKALKDQTLSVGGLDATVASLTEFSNQAAQVGAVLQNMTHELQSSTTIDDSVMLESVKSFATKLRGAMQNLYDFRMTIKATHNITIPTSFATVAGYISDAKKEIYCLKNMLTNFAGGGVDANDWALAGKTGTSIPSLEISGDMKTDRDAAIAALKMLHQLGNDVTTNTENAGVQAIKNEAKEIYELTDQFKDIKDLLIAKWAGMKLQHD